MSRRPRRRPRTLVKASDQPGSNPNGTGANPPDVRLNLRGDGAAAVLLLALTCFYFAPVLIHGNSKVLSAAGADIWNQYYYWRHFAFSALARGELPLWNPYIFSGTPYIAGIQSAIFYPLNILHLFLEVPSAVNLGIALHCFLAGLFTYLYARYLGLPPAPSFLSALTFAYGAPYFFHIYAGHLSNLSTMVWLPLLFLSAEAFLRSRRYRHAVSGGAVLALQLLAGHPQYVFYSVIAISIYFLLKAVGTRRHEITRLMSGFILFLATGAALSAVQLLPAIELTRHSVREALSYQWIAAFSLPPESLVTALLPNFFGDLVRVPYWGKNYLWEMSVYIGVVPLVMALIAIALERSREVKLFCALALLSLLLALGKYTPLLKILYAVVPGFDLFRGLSKFVFVFAFAGAILAGYGSARIADLVRAGRNKLAGLAIAVGGLGGGLIALGAGLALYGPNALRPLIESAQRSEDIYSPIPELAPALLADALGCVVSDALKAGLFLLGLAAIFFAARKRTRAHNAVWSALVAVLAAAELWGFGSRYLVTFDPAPLARDPELRYFFDQDKQPFRTASPIFTLTNLGMLDGIENAGGYDAIVLKNYSEFVNWSQGAPMDEPTIVMTIKRFSPLLRLLNVKYYVVESATGIVESDLELVFKNQRYKIYRDRRALPRSFIVHDATVVKEKKAALRMLADPSFEPASRAIVEEPVDGLLREPDRRSSIAKIVRKSLNQLVLESETVSGGLLVLSESYYPGWRAFVDGRETKIYRTNYVMRGVFVPPGSHQIEFRYDPVAFKLGGIISFIALVLVGGAFLLARIRPRGVA